MKVLLIKKRMFCFVLICSSAISQTVTINHKTQRYLGSTTDLDRTKFFTFHDTGNDTEQAAFRSQYNVTGGRGFWGPYSYSNSKGNAVGTYPAPKTQSTSVRNVSRYITTEHPASAFKDGVDAVKAADWAVEYFKNYVDDSGRPEFFEPMNEPFVHAKDFYTGGWNLSEENRIRLQMAKFYNEIGARFKSTPELTKMKMVGYSAAYPSMEINDFGHWNDNMKMFMDQAGSNMDAFSTHLYDGINVTGQDSKRSGSNSEAILDLIESYSFIKWGVVKPHAISEYGAIEKGYGDNYSDIASVQTVGSINHILFNLLEREDRMLISIPFITGKATWHINAANNYQPYQAVLWKPTNIGQPVVAGWEYTPRIYFFELWKDVIGKRVDINTDNPDIQVQAFVNSNKVYVAVNNLDSVTRTVNLDFANGLTGFQNVKIKALKIYDSTMPSFTTNTLTAAPNRIALIAGETAVLEYTFSSAISFNNAIRSKKYYPTNYLQPIAANSAINFSFNGVTTGAAGKANLRMSISRKHNVSKTPVIKVNGTTVATPTNWKGYDQANRDDFFGTIDVPVPMSLIQANNTVSITFPDAGGRVASLILNVEKYDSVPTTGQTPFGAVAATVPGLIQAENFDLGGQGVAYFDTTTANLGNSGTIRTSDAVDIVTAPNGYAVGYTATGEWMEYTVNFNTTQKYDFYPTVSSISTNGKFKILIDGNPVTGDISVPNTTNWNTYQNIHIRDISVTAGTHVVRFEVVNGGFNLFSWAAWKSVNPQKIGVDAKTALEETTETNTESVIVYLDQASNSTINIKINESTADAQIYNASGLLINETHLVEQNSKIKLNNAASGLYFVKVRLGEKEVVKKLMIK